MEVSHSGPVGVPVQCQSIKAFKLESGIATTRRRQTAEQIVSEKDGKM